MIKKFLQQCNIEEEFPSVEKDILLNDDNLRVAYQELLNTGMIQEFTLPSETPDTKWKLRFTNSIIFEYLLARYLTNSISLNAEFLNNIFTTYKNSISVQYSLLKWIIKLSFQERNIDLLRQVHQVMERIVSIRNETAGDSMPGTLRIIQNAYIEGLRTHRQSAEILLPWMAASPLGQRLYFEEYFDMDNLMYFPEESIDAYAQAVKTPDARLITCFIKFALGFYSLDNKKCSQEFEKLSQVNYSEIKNPYFQGYYFSVYFMFAYMVKSGGNMDVLEDVIEYSEI